MKHLLLPIAIIAITLCSGQAQSVDKLNYIQFVSLVIMSFEHIDKYTPAQQTYIYTVGKELLAQDNSLDPQFSTEVNRLEKLIANNEQYSENSYMDSLSED